MKNVGVYGGSFDPAHLGHILCVNYILATQPVDIVLIVPCFDHPFDKKLLDFHHRYEMCMQSFGFMHGAKVSGVEKSLGGKSFTLRMLQHLKEEHPNWNLRFVVGADIIKESPKWTESFEKIKQIAPLIVIGRPGFDTNGAAFESPVSSTIIRNSIKAGNIDKISDMVHKDTLEYIKQNKLYI